MGDETRVVWSDTDGDLRKARKGKKEVSVDESGILLLIRRLTSGKGRTIIEIKGLPNNKTWCKKLSKGLKKSIGVGGAYKKDYIEIHGEHLDSVMKYLSLNNIKYKKIGG